MPTIGMATRPVDHAAVRLLGVGLVVAPLERLVVVDTATVAQPVDRMAALPRDADLVAALPLGITDTLAVSEAWSLPGPAATGDLDMPFGQVFRS
jgi:hypothetical protein